MNENRLKIPEVNKIHTRRMRASAEKAEIAQGIL